MPQTLFNLMYPKLIPIRGFAADVDVVKKEEDTWNETVVEFNLEGNSFGTLAIQNF